MPERPQLPTNGVMGDGVMGDDNTEPWTLKRTFQATVVVAVVSGSFLLLLSCEHVFIFVFIGFVIATTLRPVIAWSERRGLTHSTATVTVYVAAGVFYVALVAGIAPTFYSQAATFGERLPEMYGKLRGQLTQLPGEVVQRLVAELPESLQSWTSSDEVLNKLLAGVVAATDYGATLSKTGLGLVAIALFAFYWSLHEERTVRAALLWAPPSKREAVRDMIDAIREKVGAYVRAQGIVCLSVALMALVAYWLIGLPYFLALALVAGVLEAVPVFGPTLGAIPAILTAVSVGTDKVPWVIGVAFVIQQIENYLLIPRVMDKSVGVNPLVTLLSIIAFGGLFGAIGAILAIPLAAILQLLLDRFLLGLNARESERPVGRDAASRLQYEASALAKAARSQFRDRSETNVDAVDHHLEETIEALASDIETALEASRRPTPWYATLRESGTRRWPVGRMAESEAPS